jgi:hypothetical protein
MQAEQLLEVLASNLQQKGYSRIASPSPVAFAMFRPAAGLGVLKLVGVVGNTDEPAVTFARAESWFKKTMGRNGAGLLLLAQVSPPQSYHSPGAAAGTWRPRLRASRLWGLRSFWQQLLSA